MHTSTFFKLFPPPKFMLMKHSGLNISDDAIHCLEYAPAAHGLKITKYDQIELPEGIIEGGDIKKEKELAAILTAFDKKNNLSYVKASLPEEKVYLFQTDIPSTDVHAVEQNIESKLEENVPLSALDAVFYFDILPVSVTGGAARASVSVVPRSYIEHYIDLLRSVGILPVAFEVVPKSIARALVPLHNDRTQLILNMMNKKTGIYIVSGGVVCFTSTFNTGGRAETPDEQQAYVQAISKEVNRVYSYWTSYTAVHSSIERIVLTGKNAPFYESALQNVVSDPILPVQVADVWRNAFNLDHYVPPISRNDSLGYVVAAGLAMDS